MDKACDLVPHFLFEPCKDFVGQLKDQIEEIVKADPKDTCKQVLILCSYGCGCNTLAALDRCVWQDRDLVRAEHQF